MKACVIHAPHDLRIEEVEVPALGPTSVKLRIGAGGICGSDLHYYQHGGFGTVRIKQPMILGHEVAGTVVEVGSAVTRIRVGDRAAINPNQPCAACAQCLAGRANLCLDVRFYGSAMRFPHVQGAFREILVADERQIFTIPDHVSLGQAAFAEPLAVCLHAVTRASAVAGRRVLVTGVGPIGALTILAARAFGAREIVATDVAALPLKTALAIGADRVIDVGTAAEDLTAYGANKGSFDVLLECSGNARALAAGLDVVRPGGTVVQLGLGGEMGLAINTIVTKELELRGSFRFHEEFGWAVDYISRGLIDVAPLLTDTIPLGEAQRAFDLAGDKGRAMKVHLSF
ncbi:MAG TPA: L-idonate 5-dehydrogenase [Aliidongia sp.]|uniref:L-idonate 5-dehydrogenase n=1 Tax=Aliidongia sp. TaxID=1914230 RepID=UPI002DDD2EA4|nr:L-idonate 5-dehydrogenase [Aliidongia sp.]HEV2674286.1 L-idonate 5-dehydrogenase [Aliidongia sp.]